MNPKGNPATLKSWKPGVSGNPGGVPAGKRVSTWILELGNMPVENWPNKKDLPANALIAMALLRKAANDMCEKASEIIMERTEGSVDRTLHLKAEGVVAGMSDEERRKLAENYLKNSGNK